MTVYKHTNELTSFLKRVQKITAYQHSLDDSVYNIYIDGRDYITITDEELFNIMEVLNKKETITFKDFEEALCIERM